MTGSMRAARTALAAKKSTAFEAAAAKAGLIVQPGKSAVKNEYHPGTSQARRLALRGLAAPTRHVALP